MIKRFMDNLCVRVRKLEEKIKNIKPIEPASATELGGVKVLPNSGIHIESDGTISVANATSSSAGIVQAGDGLTVVAGGKLNVNVASANALGGVKVGSGLSVASDGTLSAESGEGGKSYTHVFYYRVNYSSGSTHGLRVVFTIVNDKSEPMTLADIKEFFSNKVVGGNVGSYPALGYYKEYNSTTIANPVTGILPPTGTGTYFGIEYTNLNGTSGDLRVSINGMINFSQFIQVVF